MTDLIQSENLEQLTVEIKFYVNQWGQNTIEIGKRLIAAKEIVEHGDWSKWLEENFNLSQDSARNFMRVAERFGANSEMSRNFKLSQMVELLALPAEETEKFIAEKKAEGNPVEDMTVKNLRDEVAKWKADYEQKKSEVENLFHDNESLKSENERLEKIRGSLNNAINDTRKTVDALIIEKNELEQQLKNQEPIVVEKIIEKIPDDYANTKSELAVAVAKAENLQIQLDKAMKNVEKLKKTNERLERKFPMKALIL